MAEKQCDNDTSSSEPGWELTGPHRVPLQEWVRADLGILRRLHHVIVDGMADRGFKTKLADDAETNLGALGADVGSNYVHHLVAQAFSPRRRSKKTKKTKKSKKVAKRKRK